MKALSTDEIPSPKILNTDYISLANYDESEQGFLFSACLVCWMSLDAKRTIDPNSRRNLVLTHDALHRMLWLPPLLLLKTKGFFLRQ